MIYGKVNGQTLVLFSGAVVEGTINYIEAEFTFSDDWNDCSAIWAHFKQGDTIRDIELSEGKITRDMGVNLSAGDWIVYLTGHDYQGGKTVLRITTTEDTITVNESSTGFSPVPPSAVEQLEAKIDQVVNMTVGADTLPSDSDATVTKSENEDGNINLQFGIPAGAKGDKGDPGAKGDKGEKGDKGDKGDPGEGIEDLTSLNIPHVEWAEILYDTESGIQLTGKAKLATADLSSTPDVEVDIPMKAGDNMSMDVSEDGKHIIIKPELTNYVTFDDVATANKAGVVKVNYDKGVSIRDGLLETVHPTPVQIAAKQDKYLPLTPDNIDEAVKAGLMENSAITDDDKYSICKTIGAVKDSAFELIDSYTTVGDETVVIRNTEPDGKEYNFNSIAAVLTCLPSTPSSKVACQISAGALAPVEWTEFVPSELYFKKAMLTATVDNKNLFLTCSNNFSLSYGKTQEDNSLFELVPMKSSPCITPCESGIEKLRFYVPGGLILPAGMLIQIYGIRRQDDEN